MKLFVGVPTHSCLIDVACAHTLITALGMVVNRGGSFHFQHVSGASISLVRNAIVAAFLQTDADLLLMIDADQAIGADGLARMIDLGQPVVGCMVPKRRYDWSKIKSANDPAQQALEFVGKPSLNAAEQMELQNGFTRAESVGTGIILIQREAFERMMKVFPELKGRGFAEGAYPEYDNTERWGFFNPIDNEDGIPLSEDLSFCIRWRNAGGEIWADVSTPISHIGREVFRGSLLGQISSGSE